ncbi:MAG: isoleucine--tRNA ligase [Acidimicrobiia bacterium]|nr:isoleucine--tRNA ligase [Acidimicrobiia bacterium]
MSTTNGFPSLPPTPDHSALESELLDHWEANDTFGELRKQIAGGPKFSFIDGPVTANKDLGVHTAWGRTLKDVFQRYKSLRGYDQRFQNGFDCQGLWIEVGVEQDLGLNSKKEIEEYGLDRFARKCREKVAWSVEQLVAGSKRLGYWMDWGNDYLTFSDTNIEYIWRFLKTIDEKGWLYLGHRSTEWCPRCGTSLSQHEISQSGVYQEKSDPSLFVRLPLIDRPGESLVVWTTTPWTLPANVAAAVQPTSEYGRRANGEWVAVGRYPEEDFEERIVGAQMEGWSYTGPFDHLPAAAGLLHRVILWDEVTMDQGTGVVHIAPGCGAEDFDLGQKYDLAVLTPVDEAGRFYDAYGHLAGTQTSDAAAEIIADLSNRELLVESAEYVHSYPHCWRCDTPLIFRVADDWYISVEDLRQPLLDANATVEWTPAYMGKLMDDWLNNMGDWNISRRRYYGLPLPFYHCDECQHVTVIGSKAELAQRATSGMEQLEELHRPWVDNVLIACEACGAEGLSRVSEVGDVWLDAGIVPLSTLGWQNPELVPGGYGTGAAAGLTTADLPDNRYWEEWFPATWVTEMREQVRLWFYSQLFMSVAMVGKAPFKSVLGYEKMLDETGREMHGSWGNLIVATEAFEKMGADVMRWQFCAHPPDRNLLFGYGKAQQVQRKLLTLWNSAKFLIDYANIEGFRPTYSDIHSPPEVVSSDIDRWLLARLDLLITQATAALDEFRTDRLIFAFDAYIDDLSNWYIRRNRRRFYELDEAAFRSLWTGIVQALRIISPVMPFLTDHLWQVLVRSVCEEAEQSIHLAGWPALPATLDAELLEGMRMARDVAEAGRRARSDANLKLRQPLRRAVVQGAEAARPFAHHIREELRVKELSFDHEATIEVSFKPDFAALGPRLGPRVKDVATALEQGDYEVDATGSITAAGEVLHPDEVIRTERVTLDDWAVASDGGLSIAIDPALDPELILESRTLDLIREVNELRKAEGLALTDRIALVVPPGAADVVEAHREWLAAEVLAESVRVDESADGLSLEGPAD